VGGEIFRTCPDRPCGPPSLLYNGYQVFPGGKERPGREADPSLPSSAVGQERVELYLYSPYGPYGLYRASVQGCGLYIIFSTLRLLIMLIIINHESDVISISQVENNVLYRHVRIRFHVT